MPATRIADLEPTKRLVLAGFATLILAFFLLSQANLWVQDGDGSLPGPDQVLWKYNGRPASSKLHKVLDPSLPSDDPENMYPFLAAAPEERRAWRKTVLDWVDAGAPRSGWPSVEPLFTGPETCGQCHAPGGQKQDLPFDTYEHVLVVTGPDTGMTWSALLITAHNHLFAFTVAALLLGLAFCHASLSYVPARLRGPVRVGAIVAAFVGPLLDVGSWLLTKQFGAPWQFGVIAGGGLFGGAVGFMAVVVLGEAVLARRAAGRREAGGGA
jgi:hypothetical protein